MRNRVFVAALMASVSTGAMAQSVGGAASIALPDIEVSSNTKYNPYAGKFNGAIGETSDVAGINKPILDIPRSVYTVTPQTLQQRMPQSLAEAVQTLPGTFIGNTNGGNSDFITIKGFEVNTTDSFLVGNGNGLLIDGVRAPTNRAFNANSQSVELLSGPASYLYGYAAEGGIINVNRKLPLPEAHYAVDILAGALTGSFKNVAGSFDFTGPIYKSTEGVFAYRLVGSAARGEPWRVGDTVNRDFLMAPTFAFYSDVVTSVIAYEHGKNQQPYDRGVTSLNNAPLNISRTESYSEPYSTFNEKYDWVHGHTDYNLNKDTDLHLRYSYSTTGLNFNEVRSDNQGDFNPITGNINRFYYTNGPDGARTNQGLIALNGVHRFDTGVIHHELQIGSDYYTGRQNEQSETFMFYPAPFNLYNPNYGQYPTAGSFVLNQPFGAPLSIQKVRELGVFGQESATYGNLTLQGGGRYSQIYQYSRYFGQVQSDNTSHIFLPSAGALYKIDSATSLFADYSQSLHPNVFAIGQNAALRFVGPIVPQTGSGYEAGIKHMFFDGNLLAELALFRIDKKNVQTLNDTQNTQSFLQAQRSEGVSLSAQGRLSPNIDVNVAYSHQRVVVTDDTPINNDIGAQVINAPENIYTVFAAYHFLEGPLNHLTLTGGFTGATENAVNVQNSFFLPGFTVANAGFSYSFKPRPDAPLMTFSFKINNLFDTTYYPSTGSKTNWISVGEPRSFLLDLNMAL
jgi:iron complex outermembrane receptor protein